MGSYLASLVIYRQIFGDAPPTGPVAGATAEQAVLLQRAAAEAVARLGR